MAETAKKRPQDHKPKAPEKVEITIGDRTVPGKKVVVDGIEVRVPDEALDDFELLDDIRGFQDAQDASRLPSLVRRLVGAEWKTVMDGLRDKETGRVGVERASTFVMDLFEALAPNS
ncbi:hypothetical protein GJQ66_11495 [Microbacterium sp. ZXX196]|nr:hypothetical protein [Microbacterium sp. ZXX196]